MTPPEVANLITTVGFPIVMCGVLAWYVKHLTDRFDDALDKLRDQHDAESKAMLQSLDSNTQALNTLAERIKNA